MQRYNPKLKKNSRSLRTNMTDSEQVLWQHIRRKQIHGVQFYRQKPLFAFVVDFYCPAAKLVIELDGSQHFAEEHQAKDQERDAVLAGSGLRVLRFDNGKILSETDAVLEVIEKIVKERVSVNQNPPQSPFVKGGGARVPLRRLIS
ncbi:MAG: DUF559 domain-containing protein [Desulfurivibrionaceae bacterium]|jgi:very-short-patch-repair endonuclease